MFLVAVLAAVECAAEQVKI